MGIPRVLNLTRSQIPGKKGVRARGRASHSYRYYYYYYYNYSYHYHYFYHYCVPLEIRLYVYSFSLSLPLTLCPSMPSERIGHRPSPIRNRRSGDLFRNKNVYKQFFFFFFFTRVCQSALRRYYTVRVGRTARKTRRRAYVI